MEVSIFSPHYFFNILQISNFNFYLVKPKLIDQYGLEKGSLIASLVARGTSILVSFPLEYRATAQMASQAGKNLGNGSSLTGFGQMAAKNMLTTAVFFQVYERMLEVVKALPMLHFSNNQSYNDVAISTLAGGLAGMVCGAVTYPFELIRVMKISFEP